MRPLQLQTKLVVCLLSAEQLQKIHYWNPYTHVNAEGVFGGHKEVTLNCAQHKFKDGIADSHYTGQHDVTFNGNLNQRA